MLVNTILNDKFLTYHSVLVFWHAPAASGLASQDSRE